jgi:hypothetical protein
MKRYDIDYDSTENDIRDAFKRGVPYEVIIIECCVQPERLIEILHGIITVDQNNEIYNKGYEVWTKLVSRLG